MIYETRYTRLMTRLCQIFALAAVLLGVSGARGARFYDDAINVSSPSRFTIGSCDTAQPVEIEATAGVAGPTGYASLAAAFAAVNAGTHQGSVTIEICSDLVETASAVLNSGAIAPASYASVVIRPVGTARAISGNINGAVIKLNGADNVTIDGRPGGFGSANALSVTNLFSAPIPSAAIWLSSDNAGNGATGNLIRNLDLRSVVEPRSVSFPTFGIIMSGPSLSMNDFGADNDNNSFIGNRISRVQFGIATIGANGDPNLNTNISENEIGPSDFGADQIGTAGIYLRGDLNAVAARNLIRSVGCLETQPCTGGDRFGIALGTDTYSVSTSTTGDGRGYRVEQNRISGVVEMKTFSAVGIHVATSFSPATGNVIANNYISDIRSNGGGGRQMSGISVVSGGGDKIVHNSLNLTGDMDPSGATAAATYGNAIRLVNPSVSGINSLTLKNNSIFLDVNSNNPAVRFYAITRPEIGFDFGTGGEDHNNLYIGPANAQLKTGGIGSNTGAALTLEYQSLADWKAVLPAQNLNSIYGHPDYLFVAGGLAIDALSPNVDHGVFIAGVTNDIDGESRPNGSAVDIGADEFTDNAGFVFYANAVVSAAEGTSAVVTVNRRGGSLGPIAVDYLTVDGTATSGVCGAADFVAASGTLTWASGDTSSKSFSVTLCPDASLEPTETILVSLINPSAARIAGTNPATINVIDAPPGTASFAASVVVREGDLTTISVNRAGGESGDVTVDFATNDGNATGGAVCGIGVDYLTATGTLSWANGDSAAKTFTVQTCADIPNEQNETITLTLLNPTGGLTAGGPATISIENVVRSFPFVQDFESGADTWAAGLIAGSSTDWEFGMPSKTQIAGAHSGTNAWATRLAGSYRTNRVSTLTSPVFDFSAIASRPKLSFWQNFQTEPGADGAILEYSTDNGATWAKLDPIPGTGGGFVTANSNGWYNSMNPNGPIAAPKWSGTSTTFIGSASGWIETTTILPAAVVGQSNVRIRWVFGADDISGGEGFAIDDVSVASAAFGTVAPDAATYGSPENSTLTVTIPRTDGSDGAVSVDFATNDIAATGGATCAPGIDYVAQNTVLSWVNGDASPKTVAIDLCGDADNDPGETFAILLSNPAGGVAIGASSPAIVEIIENSAGTIQFTGATFSGTEGEFVTITATRTGGSAGAVGVSYATSNGTAAGNAGCTLLTDYVSVGGTLNWANLESGSKSFTVRLCNDNQIESTESINLSLNNVTGGATLGSPASAILNIIDLPPPSFEFASSSFGGLEGSTARVTVIRNGPTTTAASVSIINLGGSALSGSSCTPAVDFVGNGLPVLNFAIGESAKSIDLQICQDALSEPAESSQMMLFNASPGTSIGTQSQMTLSIFDIGGQFCSTDGNITIPSNGAAAPYPSTINVSGTSGVISSMTVRLYSVNHTSGSDIDVLLVGPNGQRFVLMSDAGDADGLDLAPTLTFSDTAGAGLPSSGNIASGIYRPTNIDTADIFSAPAPAGPYENPAPAGAATLNGVFGGTAANGAWSLYVVDDSGLNSGSIAGWCLEFTTVQPPMNLVVTNTLNNGPGSLRDAVDAAAPGSNISFSLSGCPCSVTLSNEIAIDKNLTITGPGVGALTVSGNNSGRIFNVGSSTPNIDVSISGLRMANGRVSQASGSAHGGAVYYAGSGTLTISGSVLSENSLFTTTGTALDAKGGAIFNAGTGTVNLINSTLRDNSIDGSSTSREVAGSAIANQFGTVNIVGSTISSNISVSRGNFGAGAVYSNGGVVSVINSTISGNSASGIGVNAFGGGGAFFGGNISLTNTTIVENAATVGGGVYSQSPATSSLRNSLVALNTAGAGSDAFGGYSSLGFNLIGITDGANGFGQPSDILGTSAAPIDPQILPLAANGGSTETRALRMTSPALDKGSAVDVPLNAGFTPLTTDQRGDARPIDFAAVLNAAGGDGSDIGAFELQVPTAANVTISGCVVTENGVGVSNATVIMTGTDGSVRRVKTGAFGFFRFEDVETGVTVIVEVISKRYVFAPRVFSVGESFDDLELIGTPAAR